MPFVAFDLSVVLDAVQDVLDGVESDLVAVEKIRCGCLNGGLDGVVWGFNGVVW